MLKIELDADQLKEMIRVAVSNALESHTIGSNQPIVLNRSQLMELLDISSTKLAELFNRKDFPVTRVLGHPKVLTHLLIKWLEDHTEWVQENTGPAYFRKGA